MTKKLIERAVLMSAMLLMVAPVANAGNPDRAGAAGATQLLINPWARSSGWLTANTASIMGVEAMFGNIAGMAHLGKTELLFSNTRWLEGSNISINSIGIGQKMGETGVIGISAVVLGFGDIPVQTEAQPEGGLGTFSPSMANIGISYSKAFSNSIYGGILVRVISESIANVKSSGVAIDAGIQYVAGPTDNVHFGIALKNVGPPMRFAGDGLSVQGLVVPNTDQQLTLEQRSENYELPSLLNIGAAYDFNLSENHKVTAAANYTSNSFTKDQVALGLEYGFKKVFFLRGGYMWEDGITNEADRTTVFTGPGAGVSLQLPFGEEKASSIGVDYSYRATNPFSGVHSIGVRVSLN